MCNNKDNNSNKNSNDDNKNSNNNKVWYTRRCLELKRCMEWLEGL